MRRDELIANFSPNWFTVSMGTGSLANLLYGWGRWWAPGYSLAILLAWLNLALFIIFLVPWIARWVKYFPAVKKDLQHPITGNFFVTMPLAAIILATNAVVIGNDFLGSSAIYAIAWAGWVLGVTGAILFGIYAGYNLMRSTQITPEVMNYSWLIPPVGSMAVPLIGNPLTHMLTARQSDWATTVLLINWSVFGLGFMLFLLLGGGILYRLARYSLPPNHMTPTFWIPLGPIGVGVIALMGLMDSASALGYVSSVGGGYLFATLIWGLGFWILGVALLITWRNHRNGGIAFSLSWWAFIFPLGAYATSSFKLAHYFESGLLYGYAALLSAGLGVFWVGTAYRTVNGVQSGKLLQKRDNENAKTQPQAVSSTVAK